MDIHGEETYYNLIHPITKANIKVFEEIDIEGDFEVKIWYQVFTDSNGNPMTIELVEANPSTYLYRHNMYFKRGGCCGSGEFTGDVFDNGYEIIS